MITVFYKMIDHPVKENVSTLLLLLYGGVAEWLRCSVSNHVRSIRVGLNPVFGTTNHKPTVNSAVHPPEVGKLSTQK